MEDLRYLESLCHSTYNLRYHLILATKYRRKVITDDMMALMKDCIIRIFEKHDCRLIIMNHDQDHLHMLFTAHPTVRLSDLVCVIKSMTSRIVRKQFSCWLNKFYWKPLFWSRSYYIGSVGDTTASIIETYTDHQGK